MVNHGHSSIDSDESTDLGEVPSPAAQKAEFDSLNQNEQLKEGDEWYLVEQKWYHSWRDYINNLSPTHPGPIDNSPLVNDKNELHSDVSERK